MTLAQVSLSLKALERLVAPLYEQRVAEMCRTVKEAWGYAAFFKSVGRSQVCLIRGRSLETKEMLASSFESLSGDLYSAAAAISRRKKT